MLLCLVENLGKVSIICFALEETASDCEDCYRAKLEEYEGLDALSDSGIKTVVCESNVKNMIYLTRTEITVVSVPRTRRICKASSENTLRLDVENGDESVPDIAKSGL